MSEHKVVYFEDIKDTMTDEEIETCEDIFSLLGPDFEDDTEEEVEEDVYG